MHHLFLIHKEKWHQLLLLYYEEEVLKIVVLFYNVHLFLERYSMLAADVGVTPNDNINIPITKSLGSIPISISSPAFHKLEYNSTKGSINCPFLGSNLYGGLAILSSSIKKSSSLTIIMLEM